MQMDIAGRQRAISIDFPRKPCHPRIAALHQPHSRKVGLGNLCRPGMVEPDTLEGNFLDGSSQSNGE